MNGTLADGDFERGGQSQSARAKTFLEVGKPELSTPPSAIQKGTAITKDKRNLVC